MRVLENVNPPNAQNKNKKVNAHKHKKKANQRPTTNPPNTALLNIPTLPTLIPMHRGIHCPAIHTLPDTRCRLARSTKRVGHRHAIHSRLIWYRSAAHGALLRVPVRVVGAAFVAVPEVVVAVVSWGVLKVVIGLIYMCRLRVCAWAALVVTAR